MRLQQAHMRTAVPTHHLPVFRAQDFRVIEGVNEGDPLMDATDLAYEDIYALDEDAAPLRLGLITDRADGPFLVSRDSGAGQPGAQVFLDSLLTFIGPAGGTREVLVFVEVDSDGIIAEIYLYPLALLRRKQGYALVTIDREGAAARLAGTASVVFTRGTRITLAGGAQRPVEALRAGDRVLTRDSGPQVLRWIGHDTVRATGAVAPITNRASAGHTSGDLAVSPNHRQFVCQRVDALGAGRKEERVRVETLVNGPPVTRDAGGFVDYFQLLFDTHETIYAEGIAAESLFVDALTAPALPGAVAQRGSGPGPGLAAHQVGKADRVVSRDPAETLRRLSAF